MNAEIVQPVLRLLDFLCIVVLVFYTLRVVDFVLRGHGGNDKERMRQAMAMAYTVVAAWFILAARRAIHPFVQNIIDAVAVVTVPSVEIRIWLAISSALVCTAFLCNFSRSLWMLKSLDHGIFEPVPEWEKLTEHRWKRLFEFVTRTIAALLFIFLEFSLERFAESRSHGVVTVGAGVENAGDNYLTQAGFLGLLLYGTLILWWLIGRWIAAEKMPWTQLSFYLAGLINSVFISRYAGKIATADEAVTLLMVITLVTASAGWMLALVLWEMYREIVSFATAYGFRFGSNPVAG